LDSELHHNLTLHLQEKGLIVPVDKPLTWTSFDVVSKVRVHLKYRYRIPRIKVGHAGTLDPLATGLLLVCVGKSTRLITSLQEQRKTYTGIIRLGETTPSLDGETAVDQVMPADHVTDDMIAEAVALFTGPQMQEPPVFSAIKLNGKRAYTMARKQQVVEMPKRAVEIFCFEAARSEDNDIRFSVTCSKGTYIRSLARDLGERLGTCAYLTSLRRTRSGSYDVDHAFSIENIDLAFQPLLNPEELPGIL
jgi:tRNA pseudouridine55 synthase